MGFEPDWTMVQPQHKWAILSRQKRFLFFALYTSLGSVMLGFDLSVASTSFAFNSFQKAFGDPYPGSKTGYNLPAGRESAMVGASAAGEFVGVMLAAYFLNHLGRKHLMGIGSIVTAIGAGMQIPAHGHGLFIAGRFINGIGFGAVFVLSPVWIGENVRPELRGFFLCTTNSSIVLGQFVLSCVAKGSSFIANNWQWRTLVVCQFVPVVLMMILWPFFPESPYYLITKNRPEKARQSLERIHGAHDQALIDAELQRITHNASTAEEMRVITRQHGPGFLQCLKPPQLKRTIIACLPPAGQQLIGSAFVLGYITYFLSLIGVMDFFSCSVALYVVMLVSNLSAFFFVEAAGRRTLLVPGIALLTVILFVMGCMGFSHSPAAVWVVLVCIFLWAIIYQLTIGAIGFALASEVGSLPLRPYTQAYLATSQDAFGFVVAYSVPYMINPAAADMGAKIGFVFAGLGLIATVLFYFLIPETKGLTVEEIDHLFTSGTSCRKFQEVVKQYRIDNADGPMDKNGVEQAQHVEHSPKVV